MRLVLQQSTGTFKQKRGRLFVFIAASVKTIGSLRGQRSRNVTAAFQAVFVLSPPSVSLVYFESVELAE